MNTKVATKHGYLHHFISSQSHLGRPSSEQPITPLEIISTIQKYWTCGLFLLSSIAFLDIRDTLVVGSASITWDENVGVFGTAPLQFFHLCSMNSTIEQIYRGGCGAGGTVWHAALLQL